MTVFAATLTGKGTGAISTIGLFGDEAREVLEVLFEPAGKKNATFNPSQIHVGRIIKGSEIIDEVVIGCERENFFAINCHGNPLVVSSIMRFLESQGVKLVSTEKMMAEMFSAESSCNNVEIEAVLAQADSKTLIGSKIIANQATLGLNAKAQSWLESNLSTIRCEAETVLRDTQISRLIIRGCVCVLAGPANSGKSTLLNCLCGRQKAIVTDIKGTTRDWVNGNCRADGLYLKLIDTAGLDKRLSTDSVNNVDKQSQQKSMKVLESADIVLLILDRNEPSCCLSKELVKKLKDKKVVAVLNKSDLPTKLNIRELPSIFTEKVEISAKERTGIEKLFRKIREVCGVNGFDIKTAVCLTKRQEELVGRLVDTKCKEKAELIITKLLNGQLRV